MPTLYLVTYDICHPRRLRRVFKCMRGFGDHLQYSVFRCELSDEAKVRMLTRLDEVINHDEDQVLVFNLGPVDGLRADLVEYLGQRYKPSVHEALVI
jgi:CRISPR-associated protein Cas2